MPQPADCSDASAWDAAIHASADLLIEAAIDRGVNGVEKPILFKGEVVATELQYSDSLLIELLRSRRPQEFRRPAQQVDVDVNVNAKVGIALIPMTAPDAAAWEKQANVVHEQQKRLPSFVDKDKAIDGEYTDVEQPKPEPAVKAEPKPEPQYVRSLGRG